MNQPTPNAHPDINRPEPNNRPAPNQAAPNRPAELAIGSDRPVAAQPNDYPDTIHRAEAPQKSQAAPRPQSPPPHPQSAEGKKQGDEKPQK